MKISINILSITVCWIMGTSAIFDVCPNSLRNILHLRRGHRRFDRKIGLFSHWQIRLLGCIFHCLFIHGRVISYIYAKFRGWNVLYLGQSWGHFRANCGGIRLLSTQNAIFDFRSGDFDWRICRLFATRNQRKEVTRYRGRSHKN